MNEMKVEIKKGISKKGTEYTYISVQLTNSYSKMVFLTPAEQELLKQTTK